MYTKPTLAQADNVSWLVYSVYPERKLPGAGGLWITRPGGSDKQQIVKAKGINGLSASPDGHSVAYISFDPDPNQGEKNSRLELLLLPEGTTKTITPLTTPATEMKLPGDGSPTTAYLYPSLEWSPNGQQLAFIGAQGTSNSADLFMYSVKTDKVTQLSSGASQAIKPSWSPDGKYILHFGLEGFGSGAGSTFAGAWAARADGSRVITLYKPSGGDEGSLGWIDSTSFLAWTWDIECTNHLIRAFNVETKQEVMWVKDFYQDAAYAPSIGMLLFSVRDIQAACPNNLAEGLYRMSKSDFHPVRIADTAPTWLEWSPEAEAFFGLTLRPAAKLIQITPDGKITNANSIGNMKNLPVVSPDGKFWAWVDSNHNLNVADPKTGISKTIAENVGLMIWAQ